MRQLYNLADRIGLRKKLRNSATPQEIILWSRLRRNQLGQKLRRQHSIGKYIVDFYCPKKKLIIELDGWQHKEESQERYDQERSKFLEEKRFKVIRFWNNDINNNLDGVVMEIEKYLI